MKKWYLSLPLVPVLVIELLVLNKSVGKYSAGQSLPSPSGQLAWETGNFETSRVLGASSNSLTQLTIERMLVGVILFLVLIIAFLVFKAGKNDHKMVM